MSSFSHMCNQQGTIAPAGTWVLPGGCCNLLVPQWEMERGGGDGRCSPEGVPGSAESTFSIFPSSLCAAKMQKVSSEDALVITNAPLASSALIDLFA